MITLSSNILLLMCATSIAFPTTSCSHHIFHLEQSEVMFLRNFLHKLTSQLSFTSWLPLCHGFLYFTSLFSSQLLNLLYFASFLTLWLSILHDALFSSLGFQLKRLVSLLYRCRSIMCAMSPSITLDIYMPSPIDLRPSKREGWPYKISTYHHSPQWEILLHLTSLTE